MLRVVGALALVHRGDELPPVFRDETRGAAKSEPEDWLPLVRAVAELMQGVRENDTECLIHSIALNRIATPTVAASRKAVKADAVQRVFEVSCKEIRWAVIDSGIDATHKAFCGKKVPDGPFSEFESRVRATYDFSEIRKLLDPHVLAQTDAARELIRDRKIDGERLEDTLKHLHDWLLAGRSVDWGLLAPLLRIPHDASYAAHIPTYDHGTHVAGILGGGWKREDEPDEDPVYGICPDIELYDFRILSEAGQGDEFTVMAALQFVRWLNSTNDYMAVHGVNLSLSIPHDVSNYACGRTPVCEEAERVVASGVVVVVAAGNQGYRKTTINGITNESYNTISITDPGNAEQVITVGATHRARPHTYGVSYFSSRGPTGDGRSKPDLVAPGEKITSSLPNDSTGVKDGTSMAAPHVSGAAALLMARYDELVGQPSRIKQILRDSATDLGRERYFQGAGMLDILRALQSV
jgi:subtilisin family serine protease